MQTDSVHETILKQCFPKSEVKTFFDLNGNPKMKVHTKEIDRNQLEHLLFSMPNSVDINLKRSGTGITIVLTNK